MIERRSLEAAPALTRFPMAAPALTRFPMAAPARQVCRCTIVLDGQVYRCRRDHVEGIHDAFARHGADGGVVRW